jgi:autotransporter-associated beta strand protein
MSEIEINQPHVLDLIEIYLSEGLSPEERIAFETHLADCGPCNEALAEARESDDELRLLFDESRPASQFEDRIISRLRDSRGPRRRLLHPMVLRSAAAVAAAVLLAGTGLVVTSVLQGNGTVSALLPRSISYAGRPGAVIHDSAEHAAAGVANPNDSRASSHRFSYGYWNSSGEDTNGPAAAAPPPLLHDAGTSAADHKTRDPNVVAFTAPGAVVSKGIISAGGTLDINGTAAIRGLVNPGATGGSHAFRPSQLGSSTDFTVSNATTSLEGLAKAGSGTLILDGENAFVDGTTVNGGTLTIANGGLQPTTVNEPRLTIRPNLPTVSVPDGGVLLLGGQVMPVAPPVNETATEETKGPASPAKVSSATAPQTAPASARKIIRNGTMEFEVDRFDDALIRVTKLVNEQQGFVATTDSDKLANGKMKGTVTLRLPPERLDTLVLTLRGLGDLKSQKISAEDVTKHYTDLESGLRAARAMEERLLQIIKTGTGAIKDLLAAEKELGVWREKIEQIEGEKRYLDSQVSLSTLVLTLYEKDIKLSANASETEQVNMSLETERVDEAYNKALEAIKTAKGRIVQSELKQYDAGQFGATIRAAIPPDAAEQVIARLRQLEGRIAHFAREHKQSVQSGAVPADVLHVQREDAIVIMQIYNLANIAPRRSTGMRVAVADVDKAFQQIIDQVRSVGGRIVTSSLARPDVNSQTAELDLQVPTDKADVLLDALHGYGEVMRQESAENPDTANVTEAKRGFRVSVVSLAATSPRENQTLQLAAVNVPQSFNDILTAIRAGDGRVLQSDLSEQNAKDVTGTVVFEISRTASPAVNSAIDKAAQVLSRTVNRAATTDNTVDSKVRLQLTLLSAERLAPRQTTTVREEVANVEHAVDDLVSAAVTAGGRRLGSGDMTQDRAGHVTAQVIVEVPLNKAGPVLDQLERMGNRRSKQVAFDTTVPDGALARARIDATFSNSAASLGGEETTWDAIRNGLSVSGKGFRWSVQMLVVGLCFIGPWALTLWIIGTMIRRSRSKSAKPAVVPS